MPRRQESSEESNHSITLCPRLSQLLPKTPKQLSSLLTSKNWTRTAASTSALRSTEGQLCHQPGEKRHSGSPIRP